MSFGTRKRKIKSDDPVIAQPPAPETLVGYWRDESCEIASHFGYTGADSPPVRGRGQPSLLSDPALIASLLALVAGGNSANSAAEILGISASNFTVWLDRAGNDDDGYLQFSKALRKALALCKKWNIDGLRRHAYESWTAHAWMLERGWPEEYSPRSMLDVTHTHRAGLKAPQITVIPFGTDDARKLMLMLQGSGPDEGAIDADFTD